MGTRNRHRRKVPVYVVSDGMEVVRANVRQLVWIPLRQREWECLSAARAGHIAGSKILRDKREDGLHRLDCRDFGPSVIS